MDGVLSNSGSRRSISFFMSSNFAIAFSTFIFGVFFILLYPGSNELIWDRLFMILAALGLYMVGSAKSMEIKKYATISYLFYHMCTAQLIFAVVYNHFDGFYLLALLLAVQFFAFTFRENKSLRQYQMLYTGLLLTGLVFEANLIWQEKGLYAGVICVISFLLFEAARMKNRFVGQIKMKEEMLRTLFSKTEDAMFITDVFGRILDVNARVNALFGYERNEIVGSDFKMLQISPMTDDELSKGLVELESNNFWTSEIVLKKKSGKEFFARLTLSLIRGKYGMRLVYHVLDITQIKENETRLIEARMKAEDAAVAKSQFLAMMSHELRTPLNGLLATSTLLLQTEATSKQLEIINIIDKSSKSLLMLINDILDISKIENGKRELSLKPEKLSEKVFDVVAILRSHAESKGIQICAEVEDDIPGYLMVDATRFSQVLYNLIGNAIKFTARGEVTVCMKHTLRSQDKVGVHFEIRDTGMGIPQDKFHLLFKSFSQVDSSISQNFGGTGLGLAISKQIIEMMGGEIQLESKVGVGSNFSFDLEFERAGEDKRSDMGFNQDMDTLFDYSSLSILIAEDNEINREVLRFVLDNLQVKYEFAKNGLLAVEKCRAKDYDIIFTDLNMPVMDGFEAAHIIRSEMKWQPAIIAMSAVNFEEEKQNCLKAGMNDFLPKPIELENLKLMLRRWGGPGSKADVAA